MTYHLYEETRFEDYLKLPLASQSGSPEPTRKNGRSVAQLEESPVVMAFSQEDKPAEVQQRYRRRGRIVEFCHAWIQEQAGTAVTTVPRAGP